MVYSDDMTACRHNIAHGRLQEKTHMEYFYKESLRKIREVVNILHLYLLNASIRD